MDSSGGGDGGWGRPRPKFADLEPSGREDEPEPLPDSGLEGAVHLVGFPPPGCEDTPKMELHQKYHKQCPQLKKYYTVWDNGETSPDNMRFVCVFTCPLSGERFASGLWGNNVTVEGHEYWYRTKKDAMNAAAARALDCFSLRKYHGTDKRPYERCLDAPYLSAADAPSLPSLHSGVKFPTALGQEGTAVSAMLPSAVKASLCEFYRKLHASGTTCMHVDDCLPGKENYSCWSNRMQKQYQRFTAVFTCPLTGERFASGKAGDEGSYKEDFWLYDRNEPRLIPRDADTNEEDYTMLEDDDNKGDEGSAGLQKVPIIWYRAKKEAENAAAARALDCLLYRQSTGNYSESIPQHCQEDPYAANEAPGAWKPVFESVDEVRDFRYSKQGIEIVSVKWPSVRSQTHSGTGENNFANNQDHWRDEYKKRRRADQSGPLISKEEAQ